MIGPIKGYKTIGYAIATLLAVLTLPEVQEWIADHPTYAVLSNSAVIAILRYFSTTTIFTKDDDK